MKKFLISAVFIALSINAQANDHKPLTIQEQIAADAMRDPYAETKNSPIKYKIKQTTVRKGYIPPKAAQFMKPSKHFKMKKGNTVIE